MVDEAFRATLETRSPDGGRHTLIVLRKDGFVWLVLNGAWAHSSVLTHPEADRLIVLLSKANTPA